VGDDYRYPGGETPENGHGDEHQELAESGGRDGGSPQAAGQEDVDDGNQALEKGGKQHRHGEPEHVAADGDRFATV
jgi:hypothetical protein